MLFAVFFSSVRPPPTPASARPGPRFEARLPCDFRPRIVLRLFVKKRSVHALSLPRLVAYEHADPRWRTNQGDSIGKHTLKHHGSGFEMPIFALLGRIRPPEGPGEQMILFSPRSGSEADLPGHSHCALNLNSGAQRPGSGRFSLRTSPSSAAQQYPRPGSKSKNLEIE